MRVKGTVEQHLCISTPPEDFDRNSVRTYLLTQPLAMMENVWIKRTVDQYLSTSKPPVAVNKQKNVSLFHAAPGHDVWIKRTVDQYLSTNKPPVAVNKQQRMCVSLFCAAPGHDVWIKRTVDQYLSTNKPPVAVNKQQRVCLCFTQPLAMMEYVSEGEGKGEDDAPENEELADHMHAKWV